MKTDYLKTMLMAILIIATYATYAATIHSTTTGGNWYETTTWQEGIVPGASDDVVITSNATVIVYNTGNECHNLTVEAGATLQNRANHSRTLLVHGNITNDGTLQDLNASYHLSILAEGDLVNTGTIDMQLLKFTGDNGHLLDCASGNPIECYYFQAADTTGALSLASNIEFSDVRIDLENVEMAANGYSVKMQNDTYITDATVSNFTILGKFIIHSGIVFEGDIFVQDTLYKVVNQNIDLIVNGNLTNNGVITKPNYTFNIYITGNIVNNGEWLNTYVYFTGASPQTVSLATGKVFDCENWTDQDSNSPINALTDLAFLNTDIDLNGGTLNMPASTGHTLKMNDGKLADGNFDFNDGILDMDNNAFIGDSTNLTDVILEGTVQLHGNGIEFTGEITNNAYLHNYDYDYVTTTITGNLTNNDTITNPNYHLTINVTGNIVNNGAWSNYQTRFTGLGSHSISQGTGKKFSGNSFTAVDTTGNITSLSGLTFEGTDVDLNGRTLTMPSTKGSTLSFSDGDLKDGIVDFNDGVLYMDYDAFIGDSTNLIDVTLEGTVQLHGNGIEFTGEITNNAYLRNYDYDYVTTTITGNLTNNDTITNPNYHLTINVTGNIVNNGAWSNYQTRFTGLGSHSISQGTGKKFSGNYFTAVDTTGNITSLSDLTFENTDFDLNGRTLTMPSTKGSILSFSDGALRDGTVVFNEGTLYMDNDAYIGSNTSMIDVTLEGTVQLHGNGIEFTGEIINNAYFQNYQYDDVTTTITGNLTNNDTIANPNFHLTINVTGNIVNNGLWSNYQTILSGTGTHSVSFGENIIFSGNYFIAESGTGTITSMSNIDFLITNIDLNGTELIMPDEKRLSVKGTSGNNGHITDGTISGGNYEFEGNGYSDFSDMTFSGNVTLFGNVRAVASNITFLGDVDVRDTLNTRTNMNSTLTIEGRIINNGAIINSNYHLTLLCEGHLVNNGIWTNYETRLTGTEDQLIYLVSQKEITGYVRFDAVTGTSPYQWYWEDAILDSPDFTGETSQIMNWQVPVSDTWKGDFYCVSASDTSRHIVLRSGIIVDPKVILQGPYNGTDMNTELADLNLVPLEQPFNMAPWNYAGDEVAPSIPSDIVDWVLVELRQTTGGPETATSGKIVMQRALLLRNDGVAVDPYEFTPELKYDIQVTGNIYLVVWQRNHLGVMSAVSISGLSPARYDFTTSSSQAYGGTDALIDLGNGVFGMMGGDADYSQTITQQDKTGFWEPNAGTRCGYEAYDFTLDGQIDNRDKNQTWTKTLGKQTQVPD